MTDIIWHNGIFKPAQSSLYTAFDRIRLGDGAFDTMLARSGDLIHGNRHMSRLIKSTQMLDIHIDYSAEKLLDIAKDLLLANACDQKTMVINTVISRAAMKGQRGIAIATDAPSHIVMSVSDAPAPQTTPIHAVLCDYIRRNEGSPLSRIKGLHYAENILALREAKNHGATESIFLNNSGHIVCATTGNIIIVAQDGKLLTPPLSDGSVAGIMRGILIERGYAKEKSLLPADLDNAQDIFLSNAVRGIIPIAQFHDRMYPAHPIDHYIDIKNICPTE